MELRATDNDAKPVGWVVERLLDLHDRSSWRSDPGAQPHESATLRLDTSKARAAPGWTPALHLGTALTMAAAWHKTIAGGLANSDMVTERTFWIGLYPGLDERHIGYVAQVVADFVKAHG